MVNWSFDCSLFVRAGPTVLEVFNTLLRQLRLSVDYELTGSYEGSTNIGTKIIKAHEERQLQEAVIRTIGESVALYVYLAWVLFRLVFIAFPPLRSKSSVAHLSVLSLSFRFICQHSTNIPEVRGHALHYGQDPCPWGSPSSVLHRLGVSEIPQTEHIHTHTKLSAACVSLLLI